MARVDCAPAGVAGRESCMANHVGSVSKTCVTPQPGSYPSRHEARHFAASVAGIDWVPRDSGASKSALPEPTTGRRCAASAYKSPTFLPARRRVSGVPIHNHRVRQPVRRRLRARVEGPCTACPRRAAPGSGYARARRARSHGTVHATGPQRPAGTGCFECRAHDSLRHGPARGITRLRCRLAKCHLGGVH